MVAVVGWLGVSTSTAALAFDSTRVAPSCKAPLKSAASGSESPHRSNDPVSEAPPRYSVDPLQYNERWTSMFGSELSVSDRISLFADYQYDQWSASSAGGENPFSAWESYRFTVGCSFTY